MRYVALTKQPMRCLVSISFFLLNGMMQLQAQRLLLTAEKLFDGEEMHSGWGLIVEQNEIIDIGPVDQLKDFDSSQSFPNGTIMPGMIEGHSHVLLYPYDQKLWNDQVLKESRSLRAIRGAKMAERNLKAGFTTIRDLGSEGAGYADVAIKESIELGITKGPRMIVAGKAIVATGSYGPKGFHPDFEVHLGAESADGDDLIRVVRDQIGKGADVIKVYADYRWGPNGESKPTFTEKELSLIVETANSSGRQVVAHANTSEAIQRAVKAGIRTIEHGTEASKEVLQLMAENGVALCPTLAATESIAKYFYGWDGSDNNLPQQIIQKRQMFKWALESGVEIVAGGDVGVFEYGENALELELMEQYGMQPLNVLRSVTSINAIVFELDRLGRLQKGFLADIIVVDGDPLTDISNLRNVVMVMKDGQIEF